MKPKERAVLVVIVVAIAVALRWGFAATAVQNNPLRADAGQYAQYAHNLVEHGVYSFATTVPPAPDSFRSPGYPAFLAVCKWLGGESWLPWAWTLQVLLGALTVLLVQRLARCFLPFWASLVASAITALSPHLVVAPAYVLTECLTTFLLVLGLWSFAAARQSSSNWRVAAALPLGLAVLCNEILAFVPIVLAFAELCGSRARGEVVAGRSRTAVVAFGLVALMPLGLWTARNQSTNLAHRGSERVTASISHGSYPGMVYENPRLRGFPYHEDPLQPWFGSSWGNLFDVLQERAGAEPLRYVSWYLLEKPVWLWGWSLVQGVDVYVYPVGNSPYDTQPVMRASYFVMRWLHWPLMILAAVAAVGLAWNPGRRFGIVPRALGLVAVCGTLAYLPVIPEPRYLQPFRPLLFVLTAASLHVLLQRCLPMLRRPVTDGVQLPDRVLEANG